VIADKIKITSDKTPVFPMYDIVRYGAKKKKNKNKNSMNF
jgi:hypothetical protein